MKKISILVLFTFMTGIAKGQNSTAAYFMDKINSASTGSRIEVNAKGDTILISEYKTGNVKLNSQQTFERHYLGTPYLNNGWYSGKMVLKGGEPVEGVMAYDLVRKSVYFSKNAHSQAIELKPAEFSISGHNFSKFNDEIEGAGNDFYETLVSSQPILLKVYDCSYTPVKTDVDNGYGSSSAKSYEGEYSKKEKYYMVINNKLILVKKKKSFLKSLGKYSSAASGFVSKEKLNLKNQGDIVSLAMHLSTK
jgi:hypothetical protein